MKKTYLLLICSFIACTAFSQGSTGLIAHWDMNGTVNDVSGNGHNGHASNVTTAAGINGIPNTAYYFNGTNGVVTTPYLSDLNITQYSICAIVKAQGFYSGLCQANMIFGRGPIGHSGNYALFFTDNPFDGDNCSAIDSTKDVFTSYAGTCTVNNINWQYAPQVIKNYWYKVVATWDGTNYKMYVNDTLKCNIPSTAGTFGTSTDSISIGMDIFETGAGYPYYFKGLIDDIRLYNRVLTDSETYHYGDTCGSITLQPATSNINSGGTATYTVHASIVGATYQWQQNSGTGFVNLSNAGVYSGVTTNTLTVTGVTTTMNNYAYRCLLSNSWGCADTTSTASLTLGVDNIVTADMVSVYPNPAHDHAIVQLQGISGSGSVQLMNELGQVITNYNVNGNKLSIDLTSLPSDVYILRIVYQDNVVYKKLLKN